MDGVGSNKSSTKGSHVRLGLLSDIHEHVPQLRAALARFRREEVDQVVVIGDVFEMGTHLAETVALLVEAGAVGVWGNHDFGFSHAPPASVLQKYAGQVLSFMSGLQPRLEFEQCHFTHVEPWLDTEEFSDIWYFGGAPVTREEVARSFDAVNHEVVFIGHFHRWLLASRDGVIPWRGNRPIRLTPTDRYLVIVDALCNGGYGIFDTQTRELLPFHVGQRDGSTRPIAIETAVASPYGGHSAPFESIAPVVG